MAEPHVVPDDVDRAQVPVWWRQAGELERGGEDLGKSAEAFRMSLRGEGAAPPPKVSVGYPATKFVSFV